MANTTQQNQVELIMQMNTSEEIFEIRLASTGDVYTVPSDKSVLEVLLQQGVNIPFSCEQGICGSCLTRVLEGTPDHRDMYLTPEEQLQNDQFLPCCSRSKSKILVLDW